MTMAYTSAKKEALQWMVLIRIMNSYDVCVIGEILVDFLPGHRGPLEATKTLHVHSGGAPANVAIGVTRMGGTAALLSLVGDDAFGQLALDRLEIDRVDCSGVKKCSGVQTGLCFITLDTQGERSFTHRGGDPFGSLTKAALDRDKIRTAGAIAFSCGALRSDESAHAIEVARDLTGGLVCCDPGCSPPSWGDKAAIRRRVREAAQWCDVFKCSRDEAVRYFDCDDPMACAVLIREMGSRLAVVTDGGNGAFFAHNSGYGHVPAPPVTTVDTTGAGDAFMAGLIYRLTQHEQPLDELSAASLSQHLRYASRAGASAVTQVGAVAGLPRIWLGETFPAGDPSEPGQPA